LSAILVIEKEIKMEDSGLFVEYTRNNQSPVVIWARYGYTVLEHEEEKAHDVSDMAEYPIPERM